MTGVPEPMVRTQGGDGTGDCEKRLEDMERRWRHTAADLQNVKRRYRQDFEREREMERRRAAELWLPVVDSLELALRQVPGHSHRDPESVVSGVEATYRQALDVLENLGYPRDAATGIPFDPTRHDVVAVVPDPDLPDGTVVDVIRPGYGTPNRPLRPASVTVAQEATHGSD